MLDEKEDRDIFPPKEYAHARYIVEILDVRECQYIRAHLLPHLY